MRKTSWCGLILCAVTLGPATRSNAQASIYVEGSGSYLKGGPYADFLYGGNGGVTVQLASILHGRAVLSGDAQAVVGYNNSHPGTGGYANEESYDAVTVGPRVTFRPTLLKLSPFVQMNLGFGRYHDPLVHSSTDFVLGGQAGVTRALTSRLDGILDYSYSQFGYNFGYYSPQTFGAGVMFHFGSR